MRNMSPKKMNFSKLLGKKLFKIALIDFTNYEGPTLLVRELLLLARKEAIALVPCTSKAANKYADDIIVANTVTRAYAFKYRCKGGVVNAQVGEYLKAFEEKFRNYWKNEILLEE